MERELAEKWAEALESGTYKQGTGFLHRGDRFCCLGVLLEVAGVESSVANVGCNFVTTYKYEGEWCRASILDNLRSKLGMSGEDHEDFIGMNDTDEMTFAQIAQKVREKYVE